MSYVQEENGPGPTLACQSEAEVACCSSCRLPNQANQEPNRRRLGAVSRMLEVTDCGTAAHTYSSLRKASATTGFNNNNNNNTTKKAQSIAGQAERSGSMQVGLFPLFPRATPHQPAAQGPPNDALRRPATGSKQIGTVVSSVHPASPVGRFRSTQVSAW